MPPRARAPSITSSWASASMAGRSPSPALRYRRRARGDAKPPRRWAATWMAAASASTWAPATASAPRWSTARWSSATKSPWNPSAQADPQYHFDGIHDSLRRAAAHLPRVDAIGGSAAGVYVNNEVRVGSLYRAVPRDLFDTPRPAPVLRSAGGLGRHSLRSGERWRGDGAGRLDGAAAITPCWASPWAAAWPPATSRRRATLPPG